MSKNPQELRDQKRRKPDVESNFIIFCEDEVSEPTYFKWFQTDNIRIKAIGSQKSNIDNVLNAIKYCKENDLMEYQDDLLQFTENGTSVWCVFDRDKSGLLRDEDERFDESIDMAKRRGINVAWSNDAFELWILLHLEDIDPNLPENKNRATYYNRLTQFFKNLPEQGEFLSQKTSHPKFTYKESFKSKSNFIQFVLPFLKEKKRRDLALQRAKTLEAHHNIPNKPKHEKAPCTMVHYLVEKLLQTGGKAV